MNLHCASPPDYSIFLAAIFGWGFAATPQLRLASLIIVPLVLVCTHPRVMLPVMNWMLRRVKQQPLTRAIRYGEVLGVFTVLLVRWVIYGFSYAALVTRVFRACHAQFAGAHRVCLRLLGHGIHPADPRRDSAPSELMQTALLGALQFPRPRTRAADPRAPVDARRRKGLVAGRLGAVDLGAMWYDRGEGMTPAFRARKYPPGQVTNRGWRRVVRQHCATML